MKHNIVKPKNIRTLLGKTGNELPYCSVYIQIVGWVERSETQHAAHYYKESWVSLRSTQPTI